MMTALSTSLVYGAGLEKDSMVPFYNPVHLTGPDKGTKTCPPCTYAAGSMIQIWINTDIEQNVAALAAKLEKFLAVNDKVHGFVIVTDESRKPEIVKWASEFKLEKAALCYLPIGVRTKVSNDYKLEKATNVIVVSTKKKVIASFENATPEDFDKAAAALSAANK